MEHIKWRASIGLALIIIAAIFNLGWLFGLVFLVWILPDIRSGKTHFLEPVERDENPVLFWAIVVVWSLLSLYMLLEPLLIGRVL